MPPSYPSLTDRELQILRLKAEGKADRHIAAMLRITHTRVAALQRQVWKKLGTTNTNEAIQKAREAGILLSSNPEDNLSYPIQLDSFCL
jgi:DNA-binding CsgD family transcriptional regulator